MSTSDTPEKSDTPEQPQQKGPDRRDFIGSWFMTAGLVSSYGAAAAMSVRYLFPPKSRAQAWLFVARVDEMMVGDSVRYRSPSGERIAIARQGDAGTVEDFVALSSTCPHLGCQVHWESQNERFFCPCHNGAFAADGSPTEGPPKEANQSLPRFALKVEESLLYIQVPVESLSQPVAMQRDDGPVPPGAGHDPCLHPDRPDRPNWNGDAGRRGEPA